MPRRRQIIGAPNAWMADFPDGQLASGAPDGVAHAAAIARVLRSALEGRTVSGVAEAADLNRSTLQAVLAGRAYPDLVTLAKLERVLDTRLWPTSP